MLGLMVENMKDFGYMANSTAKENTYKMMDLLDTEYGRMGKELNGLMTKMINFYKIEKKYF